MLGEDVQQGITADLVARHGLSVDLIHARYADCGGMESHSVIAAYLQGVAGLSALQRNLVAHVVNELLKDSLSRARAERAPYSDSSVGAASGYPASFFDGDVLTDRRTRRVLSDATLSESEEASRLNSLRASGLLDMPVTEGLARLPRMARDYFGTLGAAVTLVAGDRLVSKTIVGLPGGEHPRQDTFCTETVKYDRTLIINDALLDPRFCDNPHVIGPPHLRFYAGHPLLGPGGFRIGALCIVDNQPRYFSPHDERKLRTLAALVQLEALQ